MQSIIAEKREILGKKVNNLRKKGFLPAVVYGKGEKTESIAVKEVDFMKLWRSAGESTIVTLKVGSEDKNVLIHDVSTDPLKDKPVHVDFYVVDMKKELKVDVPLEFAGDSEAIKAGGILIKAMHALKIEVLPKDLPHSITVDISVLKNIGDSLAVKDIKLPKGVAALDNPDDAVVIIEAPRTEEEIKGEETAPSLEEIEVVKKGKVEEEVAAAEGEEESK